MYKLKNTLAGHKRSVNRARFSNSGKYLASAGADKTVKVWNIEKGFLLENFEEHEDGVNDVCWSSNDRYIASGSDDRSIILWSIEGVRNKDHAVKVLKGHTNYVLRIWDIWSGQCLKTLVDESNKQATFLKFSPNSQYLLSASLDHMVKLWAYASKERPIRTYTGHDNSIYAQSIDFGYFKEKRCVIAGSEDGKVFVWDLQTKEVLHSFTAHKDAVINVDSHSRLPLICSCSLEKDLTIKIWEYVPGDTEMIEDSNVPSNEVMNDD
ncbi:Protein will die slowly [Wallemia ichthyophaga EXF-994]|uniref:Protein will die slowly n=1 Tax=Wallemia ichthyophaga (strain EXF-994 / CBS 113033) TaxID=1299270 RepID=R9AKT1_WALI9|nr:Protein will die slowly [Wallemia ichthyophaga EXF-994]EOR02819.1 Protein will die slowly [Wallemia ichthyophaga EXF-994]